MADDVAPVDDGQIPFSQELVRKATHMGALVIPAGYYLLGLSRGTMLWVMVPVTAAMILIDISRLRRWRFWTGFAARIGGRMVRQKEEDGDFTGATYILLSTCLTVALFEKTFAIAALAFIVVGDTFAALIGRKFGRHKFGGGRKSVEGSLGCLLGTVLVAVLTPGLSDYAGLVGAAVAAITEGVSFDIDDNISVPIVSGLAMTLFVKMVGPY
jgi:dolichol kinase